MKDLTGSPSWPAAIRCPEDNDVGNGATFEVGYQDMANALAYLRKHARMSPIIISAADFVPGAGTVDTFGVSTTFYALQIVEANGYFRCDLGKHLPSVCRITTIEARVLPGTARSSGARTQVLASRSRFADGDGDAPVTLNAYDAGTAVEQVITLTLNWDVDLSVESVALFLRSGATGNDDADTFYNVRVSYT